MSNFNDDDYREYGDFSLPFDGSMSRDPNNVEVVKKRDAEESKGTVEDSLGGIVLLIIIAISFAISYKLYGSQPESVWAFGCTFSLSLVVLSLVCWGIYRLISSICRRVVSSFKALFYKK